MKPLRTLLLCLVCTASAIGGVAKTSFTDDDIALCSRADLQQLLGYPAEIGVLDPHLKGGIGASSAWTYYFESSDHKIRAIHFMYDGDKAITRETLDQGNLYKAPFRLMRYDDVRDIQKILQFKKSLEQSR